MMITEGLCDDVQQQRNSHTPAVVATSAGTNETEII